MRTEDGYIIHKCLNGDMAAFGLLVDKYKAGVYALAYSKLHNFHDAEDITQEVFLKAFQKLRTLRFWDNFLAWLYAITSNLCTDWIRSRSKRPDYDYIADQPTNHLDHHSIDSYREDLHYQTLHEALNSLPEKYRQILAFYYLGGMNTKEIGRFLGISPNNVSQRLRQARAELKEEMTEMMSNTYGQHRLHETFTFHIVELIKRIKTSTIPQIPIPMLPLGLSIATGIIFVIMGLTSSPTVFDPADIGSDGMASDEAILSFYDQSVETLAYADASPKKEGKETSSQPAVQGDISNVGEKMTISGKVLKDKIPIPNARVFIHLWNAGIISEGLTKVDGSFSLEFPKTDDWRSLTAVAQHPQYSYGWKKPTKDNAENIVIELHNPVTVTGTIADESGRPIRGADAQVSIIRFPKAGDPRGEYLSGDAIENSTAKTDSNGKFTLSNIPEGANLNMNISGPGYTKKRIQNILAGSQGLEFRLKREGRIEGYVTYGKTGEPAAGIKIYASDMNPAGGWEEALTDNNGYYALANLPAGEYSVLTMTPVKDLVGTIAGYVKVAEGQTVRNIDLKFVEGGFITGKVTDKDTNEPVKDHVVNLGTDLKQGGYLTETRTDENGSYRFRSAPGKMMIYTSAPGGYEDVGQLRKYVDVVEGETVSNIDFQFRKGDQLTITGRTISSDDTPVPGVIIADKMESYRQYGKSDKEGKFTISGLRRGRKFSVKADQGEMLMRGYADVEAKPDAKVEILMERYETTSVTGRVVNQQGEPIPGAKIHIIHGDKELGHGTGTDAGVADSSGNYKIAGLIVGDEYSVLASANGYREKNLESFTLKPNMPPLKDIVLPSAGKYFLEGTVKDTDGKPVARAKVITRYHQNQVLTDENGRYRLDDLPFTVEVRLNIDHPDYGFSEFWYIPTNQTKDFVIEKAFGYLSGRVVDEDGVPVEGATIYLSRQASEISGHINVGARTNIQGEFNVKNLLVNDRESIYVGKGKLYKTFKDVEMNRDGVEFVLKAEEPAEQEKPPSAEDTARREYVEKTYERSEKLKGTPAPELDVAEWLYGKPLKIKDLKGKVVVLHFWFSEAARDENTTGYVNILQKVYSDKGVVFIGIAKPTEELDKLKGFIKEKKVEYPTAVDKKTTIPGAMGVTFDKYAIFQTPVFIVIDKDGVISGRVPDFNLEERIQESLSK